MRDGSGLLLEAVLLLDRGEDVLRVRAALTGLEANCTDAEDGADYDDEDEHLICFSLVYIRPKT